MNRILILAVALTLAFSSCKGRTEQLKEKMIETRISEMKTELDSINGNQNKAAKVQEKEKTEKQSFSEKLKSKLPQKSPGDSIIGVWEVKNDYYMAIYEIIKYDDQYFGKIHYYNDGSTEIKAQNDENDYFLDGVVYKNGTFSSGTIYTPDGKSNKIEIDFKGDEIHISMTIDGSAYKETWKRKRLNELKTEENESK